MVMSHRELEFKLNNYPFVRNNMMEHTVFVDFLTKATDEQLSFCNDFFNPEVSILFLDSNSGTGKSFCSVACAYADYLNKNKEFTFVMSPVEEGSIGFRPGGTTEKAMDYFSPLHDSLLELNLNPAQVIKTLVELDEKASEEKLSDAFVSQTIHTFMRGSNIKDNTLIISESQNFTKGELKKVLTRIHDSSKVICEGHHMQIDLKDETKSGFVPYMEHFKGFKKARFHKFTKNFRGELAQFADDFRWK